MLIAGAVCPHPPLLIPAALGSAASDPPAELRSVADAAGRAVSGLAGARPDLIVVVGGGAAEREHGADASGGLHAFGVDVTVGPGEPGLPLSLTVGRWLLRAPGSRCARRYRTRRPAWSVRERAFRASPERASRPSQRASRVRRRASPARGAFQATP